VTNQPLNIFMFARGYPTREYPMNGIFEFDQAKALANLGHRVTFGALDLRSFRRKRPFGFESFEKDGVKIIALNLPVGNLGKSLTQKIRIRGIKKLYSRMLKEQGKPQVVHAQFINVGHAAATAFKERDFSLVYTEHYSGLNQQELTPHLKKLGEETYREVDELLAVSRYLGKNLNRHFGVTPKIIPNIVETDTFQYRETSSRREANESQRGTEETPEPSEFSFISVGSLQKHKEHRLLIEAFGETFSESKILGEEAWDRRNVKLYIYGGGPEKESLKALIHDLNLESQVFLMGQQPRQDIAKAMKNAQAFVLASKLETFGVAFIEAMAAGLPVISLAKGGPEDFIHTKNGSLLPEGTKEDLKTAMIRMVKEIEAYDKIAVSREIKEIFAPKKIAEALVAVYNECMKN